ncbi:hypothetical protein FZI91_12440 [Mycobacterium sp. CBMA271]|uniref:type VII secretion target n=1 Tax=unclassified Mycobacteroides TaxID=2618759 RepID=UPI00132B5E10|nr:MULTISPECIES: type VII secretion target [unclassified Mycobacteroides]MUM15999.1 hypothetical protein [Mycobacteroides sp. CBMA 326]MUM22502.1 hypothetical protein [Mycobacteroides sp. CBMA 271]
MEVNPANVRSGGDKLSATASEVKGIRVPPSDEASDGLKGFATAAALQPAADSMRSSLSVAAGRYDEMGQLLHRSADSYEDTERGNTKSLSELAGTQMSSMGDLNSAR